MLAVVNGVVVPSGGGCSSLRNASPCHWQCCLTAVLGRCAVGFEDTCPCMIGTWYGGDDGGSGVRTGGERGMF